MKYGLGRKMSTRILAKLLGDVNVIRRLDSGEKRSRESQNLFLTRVPLHTCCDGGCCRRSDGWQIYHPGILPFHDIAAVPGPDLD